MFNKEEEKTVISMDMGGKIEPVELPKEEDIKEEVQENKSSVVPQLMQIDTAKDEVPQIVDAIKVVEVPKPTPTIGEVKPNPTPAPTPVPTITEVKPPVVEEKKEEVKTEVKEGPKVDVKPTPVIMPLEPPKPAPTTEVKPAPVPVTVPKPVPTIGEVKKPVPPTPVITEVKKEAVPTPVVNNELDKTVIAPKVEEKIEEKVEEIKEEVKEEPKVEYGPNVISEPLAKEDSNKEKKKNPHFLECPPNCKPIRPLGYIMLNILYMIPVIGLIFILAHSASYKNLNRRNYARSYLIAIFLIILIIFALIYFLKIDFIGIIENIIGYKIDLQHFKFIKFK